MSDPLREVRDPMLGRALGRFTLRARLGSGAIGSVYRADDAESGTSVALKVLLPEVARNLQAVQRLHREAAFARRIAHPNVVRVLDVGEDAGTAFVAMELIAGRSLEETIAHEGALTPERAGRITLGILSALAEAHSHGIVHRDLKPANVMIELRDGVECAKLVDFGVARILDDEELSVPLTRLTRDGFTVGTPAYMAPEQFGSAAVGPEADLYAVGLVLYEMLAGAPAFGGTLREVVVKQMTEPPPPLSDYGGLGPLVVRLTAKETKDRPAAATEVHAELRALVQEIQKTAVTTVPVPITQITLPPLPPLRPESVAAPSSSAGDAPQALDPEPGPTDARADLADRRDLGDPLAVARRERLGALPWALAVAVVVALAGFIAWRETRPQVIAPAARETAVADDEPAPDAPLPSEGIAPDPTAPEGLAAGAPVEDDPDLRPPPAAAPGPDTAAASPAPAPARLAAPARPLATAAPAPRVPRTRTRTMPSRAPDPCRAGSKPSAAAVQACVDRVDAALRAGPPGNPLWSRYTALWDRVATAHTPAARARLLDDFGALLREVERSP